MKLVYIYGPPAAGKLTVATHLAELTGFKLFHNHLTMNAALALFEFGSDELARVLFNVRIEMLGEAARSGIDVIFTNANHRPKDQPRPSWVDRFAAEIGDVVRDAGGDVLLVHLRPRLDVVLERVVDPSRVAHGKLTDLKRYADVLIPERELYDEIEGTQLSIDNSDLPPDEVAKMIAARFNLSGPSKVHRAERG